MTCTQINKCGKKTYLFLVKYCLSFSTILTPLRDLIETAPYLDSQRMVATNHPQGRLAGMGLREVTNSGRKEGRISKNSDKNWVGQVWVSIGFLFQQVYHFVFVLIFITIL